MNEESAPGFGCAFFLGYWRLAPVPEDEGDDDDEDYAEDDSEPHLSSR
jgi:hypothetical protein